MSALLKIDLKEAVRSRWFALYIAIFVLVAGGFVWAGTRGEIYGYAGVGKFLASIINVAFLLIPLFAVLPSSLSVAGARENLSLEFLFSLPISKVQIFISKFLSVFLAVAMGPVVALIAGSFALGPAEVNPLTFLAILILIFLLAFVFVSAGMLISVLSPNRSRATALAVFVWFLATVGGEIGVLGYISAAKVPTPAFFPVVFLNPAETFRVASISLFSASLDVLGPFGLYIWSKLGKAFLPVCMLVLSVQGLLLLAISALLFVRRR